MNKKIIGIVCKENKYNNKDVYTIDENFNKLFNYYDITIIGIIKQKNINNLFSILKICDGFIIQGGINNSDYEKDVLKYAINNNKPILGICAGMQLMASLYKDNLNVINESIYNNHDVKEKYVHNILIDSKSKLYNIVGKSNILVNSTHNEHIIDSGIYTISSYSEDGIIESIEYNKNKFNIGVQFHPERLFADQNIIKLFDSFINSL